MSILTFRFPWFKSGVIPSMSKCKQMKFENKEKVNHDQEESKDPSEEDKEKEDHLQNRRRGASVPEDFVIQPPVETGKIVVTLETRSAARWDWRQTDTTLRTSLGAVEIIKLLS